MVLLIFVTRFYFYVKTFSLADRDKELWSLFLLSRDTITCGKIALAEYTKSIDCLFWYNEDELT
jgi:hypothetical protein